MAPFLCTCIYRTHMSHPKFYVLPASGGVLCCRARGRKAPGPGAGSAGAPGSWAGRDGASWPGFRRAAVGFMGFFPESAGISLSPFVKDGVM